MKNEISDKEWFHSAPYRWAIEVSWKCPVFKDLGYAKFDEERHAQAYQKFIRSLWPKALIIRKDVQRSESTYRLACK